MKMIESREQVVLEPATQPTAAIIWLHGLGASGHDFVPVVPHLQLSENLAVRFIFPHAPVQPVTVNGGMPMPAWYDILAMGDTREIDEVSLQDSVARIQQQITSLLEEGIAAEKILLIGFSQGGAVAYQSALSYPQRLAGVAALSTYLATDLTDSLSVGGDFPIWIAHGEADDVVPFNLGRKAYDDLKRLELQPQWYQYPMGHEVCLDEITDLGLWITEQLN